MIMMMKQNRVRKILNIFDEVSKIYLKPVLKFSYGSDPARSAENLFRRSVGTGENAAMAFEASEPSLIFKKINVQFQLIFQIANRFYFEIVLLLTNGDFTSRERTL